jgi:hypothetical protein
MNKNWEIVESLHIVKKYKGGYCFAIRFAPDMTVEEIAGSLDRNPPKEQDWAMYNESNNQFLYRSAS